MVPTGCLLATPDITVLDKPTQTEGINMILLTSDAPFERDRYDNERLIDLVNNILHEQTSSSTAVNYQELAQAAATHVHGLTTDDTCIIITAV